jgi:hypothetical protein
MLLQTRRLTLLALFVSSGLAHVLLPRALIRANLERAAAQNVTTLNDLGLEHTLLRRSKLNGPCTGAGGAPGVCISTTDCAKSNGKVRPTSSSTTALQSDQGLVYLQRLPRHTEEHQMLHEDEVRHLQYRKLSLHVLLQVGDYRDEQMPWSCELHVLHAQEHRWRISNTSLPYHRLGVQAGSHRWRKGSRQVQPRQGQRGAVYSFKGEMSIGPQQ